MATSKRSPKKPTSKKTSHTSRAKSRPRSKRRKVGLFSRLREGFAEAVSLEFFGFVLLAVGLFFTAAFLTGRGAVLGDAGLAALRMFLGIPGVLLAPLAAIWGLLLILGRPAWRRALGTAMLLISFSTTLAAGLPENTRFDPESYARAGGIVGSGIYDAVYLAGGTVGAAFALAALYLLGLSLLTGISLQTAFGSAGARDGAHGVPIRRSATSPGRGGRLRGRSGFRSRKRRLRPMTQCPSRSSTRVRGLRRSSR